jgi:hypothetical protein
MPAAAGGYHNQPLAVQLANGSWLTVLTDAGYREGEVNQRVVSRVHVGADIASPEWGRVVDIQNDRWGPSAGWGVPLLAPKLGRVYVELPPSSVVHRWAITGRCVPMQKLASQRL